MAKSWTPAMAATVLVAGIALGAACDGLDRPAREAAEVIYTGLDECTQDNVGSCIAK
jgi:hypothetical protein